MTVDAMTNDRNDRRGDRRGNRSWYTQESLTRNWCAQNKPARNERENELVYTRNRLRGIGVPRISLHVMSVRTSWCTPEIAYAELVCPE
jgi:hypothetical protein